MRKLVDSWAGPWAAGAQFIKTCLQVWNLRVFCIHDKWLSVVESVECFECLSDVAGSFSLQSLVLPFPKMATVKIFSYPTHPKLSQ